MDDDDDDYYFSSSLRHEARGLDPDQGYTASKYFEALQPSAPAAAQTSPWRVPAAVSDRQRVPAAAAAAAATAVAPSESRPPIPAARRRPAKRPRDPNVVSRSQARHAFALSTADLAPLPSSEMPNPIREYFAPMHAYQTVAVEQVALQKHGSQAGIEAACAARKQRRIDLKQRREDRHAAMLAASEEFYKRGSLRSL